MKRESGILLHITSLPSRYGIGQLGAGAKKFVDFLAEAKQSYWQVLPLVPTGYGDSPYQSCCASAGSEYFIDLDLLAERGLLTNAELEKEITPASSRIDYEKLFYNRFDTLRKAFARRDSGDALFAEFVEKAEYSDYALYRTLKEKHNHRPWNEWEEKYKKADKAALAQFAQKNKDEILFWQWCQFEFRNQWQDLKSHANARGIKIIGDMPIYLAYDSVECWLSPDMMLLDDDLNPTVVAGCPPDYFCADGQLWGNPIYDWDKMTANGYQWWQNRLLESLKIFDVVRIDHFRGFDRYFAVPFGDATARNGEWRNGPSHEMFATIESKLGKVPVIAEDLGTLDDSAREMFKKVGYPGMKILEYAFDNPHNDYLPHNYTSENCVVYTGTHDNDTISGFISNMSWQERDEFRTAVLQEYQALGLTEKLENETQLADAVVRLSFESKAYLCVNQLQDFMGIGSQGRINEPSTLSTKNWSYRIPADYATQTLINKIKNLTEITNR